MARLTKSLQRKPWYVSFFLRMLHGAASHDDALGYIEAALTACTPVRERDHRREATVSGSTDLTSVDLTYGNEVRNCWLEIQRMLCELSEGKRERLDVVGGVNPATCCAASIERSLQFLYASASAFVQYRSHGREMGINDCECGPASVGILWEPEDLIDDWRQLGITLARIATKESMRW